MKTLIQLLGVGLMVYGIYFLGQNIFFTTRVPYYYWYSGIAATGSAISMLLGMMTVAFAGNELKTIGWFLIGLGVALIFISGRIVLQPTSLWEFFLGFVCIIGGYKMFTLKRI
ncbi:MAG: hypothetical protein WCO45_00365 [Pseudanabaena sp. ELA607]|jgi:hypothetical protein